MKLDVKSILAAGLMAGGLSLGGSAASALPLVDNTLAPRFATVVGARR